MATLGDQPADKLEVFISYAREDLAFADELVAGLELLNFQPIIDRQSIKAGEDYQTRIGGLLLSADTVVFILSPDSVSSRICIWEVEEAVRLSKRILPILWRPVDMDVLPEKLGRINYIRFDEQHSFAKGLKELSQTLREDLGWLREHTKLTARATEWEARGRPEFRLLSGDDIAEAKAWRDRRPKNAPEVTDAQAAYIAASEAAQTARASAERKHLEDIAAAQDEKARALAATEAAQIRSSRLQRRLVVGAVAAAAVFAGLGVVSFLAERRAAAAAGEAKAALELAETRGKEAEDRRRDAEAARQAEADQRKSAELAQSEAERLKKQAERDRDILENALKRAEVGDAFKREAQLEKAHALTAQAQRDLEMRNLKDAIENAVAALPDKERDADKPYDPEAERVLYDALQALPRPRATLIQDPSRPIRSVAFSGDGRYAVSTGYTYDIRGSQVHLWDMSSEKRVATIDGDRAALSPDGKLLAVAKEKTFKIFDTATQSEIATTPLSEILEFAAFTPDNTRVGVAYGGDFADLFDVRTGQPVAKFQQPANLRIHKLAFSPDSGRVLAISNYLYTARVFDAKSGRELLKLLGHRGTSPYGLVMTGAFSPDGKRAVTGGNDTAILWDAKGSKIGEFPGATVSHVAFSPKSDRILIAHDYVNARIWETGTAKAVGDVHIPSGRIVAAEYSADGARILVAGSDGIVLVADSEGQVVTTLLTGKETILSAALSPDGQRVLTGTQNGTVQVWDVETRPELAVIKLPQSAARVSFSDDARTLIIAGGSGPPRDLEIPAGAQASQGAAVTAGTGTRRTIELSEDGTAVVAELLGDKKAEVARLRTSAACQLQSPALSRDGTRAAALCGEAVYIWRVYSSTQDIVSEANWTLGNLRSASR